ncbi:MAG: DUF4123 domain-containing protein, partial [bacterium]|nr:DUF4123 domain-containing protein [bacterium]
AVLDAARDRIIYPRLAESVNEKVCLFMGDQALELATVAPYLVALDADDPFTQWILDHGWGNSWGIFAESDASFKAMRNHLRKFLKVMDEDLRSLYFRYYDPRVLRVFLPTCDPEQLETMFGPVARYYAEAEDADTAIQYSLRDGKLIQNDIRVGG